ncbi:transcriptional regulator [Flexivirga endophytica]|uniref:Transcriptional regulator n=1 Tax=Flexivirga endophytica TaxID=1849103 RepID=A0A916WZ24_9MICO|nr:LCP family protein [Flexivirga endophytica]GGB43550.1 transcriptional regulator [Flexivirga endophytica]GHB68319.1 transcriptional regulator [Flexivirga endophytica]
MSGDDRDDELPGTDDASSDDYEDADRDAYSDGADATAQQPADGAPAEGAGYAATATRRGRRHRRRKKAGWLKVTLLSLLSMFLVIVLALVGFALYLNHVLSSNITHGASLPSSTVKPAADAGNSQNILLLGSDTRSGTVKNVSENARADVIQLVHISKGHKSVQVIHFPRDLYVSIPGHGKNKINAAFAYGGPGLLAQTISQMLGGIVIDRYAIIDFKGFADLTDDLGGVNVFVAQAFDEKGYGKFSKGYNKMNGDQALGFVRERHQLAEGDIDRGRNQQAWISAVVHKTLSAGTLLNPVKLTNTVKDLTKYTQVDADTSSGDIRNLALDMRNLRSGDITYYTAPFSGFANDPVAGSIDVVNKPQMKKLGRALYHDKMSDYSYGKNSIQ